MRFERCKSCGGELNRVGNYYVCKFCGNKWMIDADNDVHVIDRANAWSALRDCDFERAVELFENIIFKESENHEAYWGRALASAGIMYVTDFHDNKKVPTCNSISENSFIDSRDITKAIELAPKDIAETYRDQAEQIEAIRSEWVKKASQEPAYDIFICYKDSDRERGIDRTDDSYDAQELYNALVEEGYKVFFSRVSLRNKISEHYEPYIYNAIKTSKVMIAFGEKTEYFSSVWVKNEWMRFRKRIENGEKHTNSLVVAYKNLDPTELPSGLRSRQCMNADDITFFDDLKNHIDRIINPDHEILSAGASAQTTSVGNSKKSKAIKIALAIGAVLLVLAVVGLSTGLLIDRLDENSLQQEENALQQRYDEAYSLLDEGKFDDAYNLFYELGNYSDSKEMLNECIYQKAIYLLEYKMYSAAVDLFEDLDGYKKSETKIQEAKYAYVLENKNNDDMTTYNYLSDLSNQNYADSKKIYASLYDWKVEIVINTSETDTSTNEMKIDFSRYGDEYMYVHFTITGGEPKSSLNIVAYMVFPDGTYYDISRDKPYYDGNQYYYSCSWVQYELRARAAGVDVENRYGNVAFEFYDDDGNLLASKSVKVSE